MASGSAPPSTTSANGACMAVKVVMISRQMCSTVASGRAPRWRATRRRIMSASRPGRKAAPGRLVPLVAISASITELRSTSRRCTSASMASIRKRSEASVGASLSPESLAPVAESLAPVAESRAPVADMGGSLAGNKAASRPRRRD